MARSAAIVPGHFPLPVEAARVRGDWAARGFSCQEFNDPPGQTWNDFVHSTNELVTVVEGRLELLVEAERFVVEVGDEAFIPRLARHSVRNLDAGYTRWLFGYDR